MRPGVYDLNKIDPKCNSWDCVRWIFVIWTFIVPMICLVLNFIYHIHIGWLIGTFFSGILFLIIAHLILLKTGQFKSTYEMVEKEIEIGNTIKEQSSRAYSLCDGCNVELSASDDVIELSCKHQHIICSQCYNNWMSGIAQCLGHASMTQAWRIQLQFALCPICDNVVINGQININIISKQINNINNNKHPNDSINYSTNNTTNIVNNINTMMTNSNINVNVSENSSTTSNNSKQQQQMILSKVDLSSSNINININNIQSAIHITHSSSPNTHSESSNNSFEIIKTTDFLNAAQ